MKMIIFLAAVFSPAAFASFELRAHAVQFATPKTYNNDLATKVLSNPAVGTPTGFGGDLVFVSPLPILSFTIGLRYEQFDAKNTAPATIGTSPVTATNEVSGNRFSLLAGYRFPSLPFTYIGILGHYGLSQTLKGRETIVNAGATTTYDLTGTKGASYGAAVEAGVIFADVLLGVEAGYSVLRQNGVADSTKTVLASPTTLDLSGSYIKIVVGLSI